MQAANWFLERFIDGGNFVSVSRFCRSNFRLKSLFCSRGFHLELLFRQLESTFHLGYALHGDLV